MALNSFYKQKLNAAVDNERTQKLVDWANTIPMDGLWKMIRELTKLPDLEFTSNIVTRGNRVCITFESQDLADRTGFLNLIFKELYIADFNSEVTYPSTPDMIEDFGTEPYWWGTAEFRYKHPNGGSNGVTFLSFFYNDKDGWSGR